MSFNQFKWIDLLIFSFVGLIFEVINRFASINFNSFRLIFMSFTIVLTLISMYRWGIYGLIVMLFSSLISIVISSHNKEIQYYASYIGGGILGMLLGYLIFQKLIGKKRIKNNFLIITYLICDFGFVILFRCLISSLFDVSKFSELFVNNLKSQLVQESMSIFTSSIILLVANRKKGNILIEMNQYVKDVHDMKKLGNLKEMKESPNFNSDSPFTEYNQIDDSTILDGGTLNIDQLKELSDLYENSDIIKSDSKNDSLKKEKEPND